MKAPHKNEPPPEAKQEAEEKPAQTQPGPNETKAGTDVAVYDYGQDAGAGFEGVDKNHLITPLLDVLQSGSPEIQQSKIEGAKAGDFICRALGETYSGATGVPFIPIGVSYCYNEWKPRDKGGGLVAVHAVDSALIKQLREKTKFGKLRSAEGNDIIETFYLLGLVVLTDGSTRRMAVPFTSTKIPRYKALVTKANAIVVQLPNGGKVTPPFFSHKYRLKTIFVEKNNFKWHNYAEITFDGADALAARLDPRGALYQEAKTFAEQNKAGQVKVDAASAQPDEHDDSGSHGPSTADRGAGDDSPPF